MKKFFVIISLHFYSFISLSQKFISDSIPLVANKASIKKLSSDFKFTEGPIADKRGNVYFTDQPNDRIMKWSASDGTITTYMEPSGRSNGLYLDKEGNIISCADEKNQMWKINKNKNVEVLIKDFNGKRLNGPNDLWIRPDGNIYFTDPFYPRDYWSHKDQEIVEQRVYYYNVKDKSIKIVDADLKQPNGIIGSTDGKTLYVADIRDWKTYSYTINPDGSLTDKKLFCAMGSDGMTVDSKGNVYLTGRGVTIFDKQGKRIGNFPTGEPWTANITFGGKKRKTLFITASTAVYTLEMKVKG